MVTTCASAPDHDIAHRLHNHVDLGILLPVDLDDDLGIHGETVAPILLDLDQSPAVDLRPQLAVDADPVTGSDASPPQLGARLPRIVGQLTQAAPKRAGRGR